jgi:hypothetical protein
MHWAGERLSSSASGLTGEERENTLLVMKIAPILHTTLEARRHYGDVPTLET